MYALSFGSLGNFEFDLIHGTGVSDGAEISQLIPFSSHNFAHDTAHDLGGE